MLRDPVEGGFCDHEWVTKIFNMHTDIANQSNGLRYETGGPQKGSRA
jgi:hypothetical protein